MSLHVVSKLYDSFDDHLASIALELLLFLLTKHFCSLTRTIDHHFVEFTLVANVLTHEHLDYTFVAPLAFDFFHLVIICKVSTISDVVSFLSVFDAVRSFEDVGTAWWVHIRIVARVSWVVVSLAQDIIVVIVSVD